MGCLLTLSINCANVFGIGILPEKPKKLQGQSQPSYLPIHYADIYVNDNNTAGPWDGSYKYPFQHIQCGINKAENGDIIYVFSGTYVENVKKKINYSKR